MSPSHSHQGAPASDNKARALGPAPPPAPGFVEDAIGTGRWLFRWRSYLPVLILVGVLVAVGLSPTPAEGSAALRGWISVGMALGVAGLVVRGWALGLVPSGTSGRGTREFRADSLNTTGVYSLVRHPLYVGNLLLWIGVVAVSGKVAAMVITWLAFWLYYERIMMAEERFLYERFPEAFGQWARRTRAFVPRMSGWVASVHPFSFRYCLGRDYQAMYGFVAASTAIAVTRSLGSGSGWLPGAGWILYFLSGTGLYVALHLLKRKTRLLEVADR